MRNIPIPVDVARLTFVCVSAPRPRLLNQETGEVKTDRQGNTVYAVSLSASDVRSGRVDLMTVSMSGDPGVTVGQVVEPIGLVAFPWEQVRNGETRWGIAFRADSMAAVPTPSAAAVAQPAA